MKFSKFVNIGTAIVMAGVLGGCSMKFRTNV